MNVHPIKSKKGLMVRFSTVSNWHNFIIISETNNNKKVKITSRATKKEKKNNDKK